MNRLGAIGLCLTLFLAVFSGPLACAQAVDGPIETGFLNRTIELNGSTHRYQVYVPQGYTPESEWPIILFLHGAGERGTDGLLQSQVGLGSAIRKHVDRWQAVVVMPQVPVQQTWQAGPGEVAIAALDASIAEFSIDRSREYLTGLSMGGNGTWYLSSSFPDRFAAIAPICAYVMGGGSFPAIFPETEPEERYAHLASVLKDVPTWIFHGDADPVVSVTESQRMNAEFEKIGANVHYTELPGVGHNAWDDAYDNLEFIDWLFSQRKQKTNL